MRDLADVMNTNIEARERSMAGAEPGAAAFADTVRAVRRRRVVRHMLQSVGAGSVVLALAGVSWFGLRTDDHPTPAHTPTVSPTPTTSSSPAATPTAAPVVLDEIPGLPPTQALPPGLLASTTPGWVLTVYRSAPQDFDSLTDPVAHTVVLVSPIGDRYRVVDLPLESTVSLVSWKAGSTTAVVFVRGGPDGSGDEKRETLDLVTGHLEVAAPAIDAAGQGVYPVDATADGSELWSVPTSSDAYTSDLYRVRPDGSVQLLGGIGYRTLLDPTGRWLATNVPSGASDQVAAFAVIDTVDGTRSEYDYGVPGQTCEVVGWVGGRSLLVFCVDVGYWDAEVNDPVAAHAGYHRVDLGSTASTTTRLADLGPSEPRPWTWNGASAGAGSVVFAATRGGLLDPSACPDDAYVWQQSGPAVPTHLSFGDTLYSFGSSPRGVLVESGTGCSGDSAPSTLRELDPATGLSTVLAPPPPATADVPRWAVGLSSWVVGR